MITHRMKTVTASVRGQVSCQQQRQGQYGSPLALTRRTAPFLASSRESSKMNTNYINSFTLGASNDPVSVSVSLDTEHTIRPGTIS